jgi:hypothetical protein
MATLPKVLSNQADTKSAGGVAPHLRIHGQREQFDGKIQAVSEVLPAWSD